MMIILTLFNFLLPIFTLPILILYVILSKTLTKKKLTLFFFNISFSFASYSHLFDTNQYLGDIYMYNKMYQEMYYIDFIGPLYDPQNFRSFYYSWYYLLDLFTDYHIPFSYFTFFCVFILYMSSFKILMYLYNDFPDVSILKLILFKMLTMISIVTVTYSYRMILGFVLTTLAITLLFDRRYIIGLLILFIGVGFHPATLVILLIFIISYFINYNISYLILSCSLAVVLNSNLLLYISKFINNSFLVEKINEYVTGEWSYRTFEHLINYFIFYGIISYVLFFVISLIYNNRKIIEFDYLKSKQFINFLKLYFIFSLPMISYRTLSDRFLFTGGGFILLPLAYVLFLEIFRSKSNLLKALLLVVWFLYIDLNIIISLRASWINGEFWRYYLYSPLLNFN